MGVATSLFQRYLPPTSQWTTEIIDAIPFIVIALFLIYSLVRRGKVGEIGRVGGALDRAITPQGESRLAGSTSNRGRDRLRSASSADTPARSCSSSRSAAIPLLVQRLLGRTLRPGLRLRRHLPVLDHRHGRGRHALALPDHLRRGGRVDHRAAGQQPRLARPGGGRRRRAHRRWRWERIVGFLSIRLGDLYVALVTLTFGLLMENLVFTLPTFVNQGLGLTLNRPGFASSDLSFAYLCLAVLRGHRPCSS